MDLLKHLQKMIKQIIKLIRIKQWIKNTFVLAPLLFSLNFVNFELCIKSGLTFLAFSFSASIIYIINDILDRKKDAIHPIKKNRPIANGTISIKQALFIIFVLFTFPKSITMFFSFSFLQSRKLHNPQYK